ncbi:MAG TPA: TonB-dependent receptor [Terriglobales bacterium]|nr:TonB-dependent receptor [Terriglobales bacterium]
MRFSRVFARLGHAHLGFALLAFAFLKTTAFAADLRVQVVDPQSAAVFGAQVELLPESGTALAVERTSAEGLAVFHDVPQSQFHVRVLAPGFGPQTVDRAASQTELTVHLHLAPAAETVVVTATSSPVTSETSGATVSTLSSGQLEVMRPVAADGALRFLPGAVISTSGQRGGLASLFVRGGDSTYNKVIVDGVTINVPNRSFDFGNLPLTEADRLEFMRGTQSTLYGTDAMTSVVQVWTRTGSTQVPELRFGADGGNFGTANGYASLSGARGPFDYNVFGDQFNTNGQGVNDAYSDSLQGANLGAALSDNVSLRLRIRHSNSNTGVPGEWNFNGAPLLEPNPVEASQLNNLLSSLQLTVTQPSGWQHRVTWFDYNYQYTELDLVGSFPTHEVDHIGRAGVEYQGSYLERSWTQTTIGYRIEDENGFIGDVGFPPIAHGQRLNQDVYAQQQATLGRLSAVVGVRFVHNSLFGNTAVPRVALTLLALRGGQTFSGTRLRFSFADGFLEPGLDQTFATAFSVANPGLQPERNRAFEAGLQQNFLAGRYVLTANYFNNLFYDQIEFGTDPQNPNLGQYFNVDKSLAHGAEVELQGKIRTGLLLSGAYTYTSTQILQAPLCTPANFCDPVFDAGNPFLRRPKQLGSLLLTYLGSRWGGNLGVSAVGRRFDSDFLGLGIDHAAGYARVDMGAWYQIHPRITAYANLENALDKQYNEVVGYPALGINIRAGFRFRIGGE